MRRVFRVFAALLFSVVLPLGAEKVRIGFYLEDGFCGLDEKGERTGLCVDWAAAVAPINDWETEWVNCSWSGGLDRLAKGEIDVMVATVYRRSRRSRWLYPHIPLAPFRTYLFVRPGSPLAENTQTLEGARIGVPAEYVHADILRAWLKRKDINCSIRVYQTVPELERALNDGSLDAALGSATRNFVKHKAYIALPALPLYVAVNPRRPDLAEACDRAATILNELDPDFLRRITKKHFTWRKEIRPLHDISRDRDLSVAMSAVLAEGSAFATEAHDVATRPEAGQQDVGPFVIAIILLVFVGVLGYGRLMRALSVAKSAARAKANFLATMSHEIRTPLNAVVGFTELLDDPQLGASARREYLDGIKFASGALVSLIDDVLDLSKLEAERMDVLDGSVDPVRLVSEMESIFAFRTSEKGILLRCSAVKGVPRLALRESCVRQMLLNLIGNAVKFTDEGAIHCRIAAVPDGVNTVTFLAVVRDTGCGIPPEKLATLFDPFVQASDSSRDRVYKGTGLGLAIVKRLVEAAHGTLEVRSELGRGTAFAVRIPHVRTLGAVAAPTPLEQREAGRELPPLEKMSFLIVDDVPINLKVLQLHLRNLGIEDIRAAESGAEALHLLKLRPAHVVLTDLWMPEMTGEQLARTIRANADFAGIRVVVITADADAGASFDLTVFDAVTTKPITSAKLHSVFSTFLMPRSQN